MFQRLAVLLCCSGLFIWFLVIIGKESAASTLQFVDFILKGKNDDETV